VGIRNVTQAPKSKARSVQSESYADSVCFDCEDIIRHEFLLRGQMVNEDCYLKVMKRLREAVRRKMPDMWRRKNGQSLKSVLKG